jgi:hypothetical protein
VLPLTGFIFYLLAYYDLEILRTVITRFLLLKRREDASQVRDRVLTIILAIDSIKKSYILP